METPEQIAANFSEDVAQRLVCTFNNILEMIEDRKDLLKTAPEEIRKARQAEKDSFTKKDYHIAQIPDYDIKHVHYKVTVEAKKNLKIDLVHLEALNLLNRDEKKAHIAAPVTYFLPAPINVCKEKIQVLFPQLKNIKLSNTEIDYSNTVRHNKNYIPDWDLYKGDALVKKFNKANTSENIRALLMEMKHLVTLSPDETPKTKSNKLLLKKAFDNICLEKMLNLLSKKNTDNKDRNIYLSKTISRHCGQFLNKNQRKKIYRMQNNL